MLSEFGGRCVPELLIAPLDELEGAWKEIGGSHGYRDELQRLLETYAGRL